MDGSLESYVFKQSSGGKSKNWQKVWMRWDHSKRMLVISKTPDSDPLEYIPIVEWIGASVDMGLKSKLYNFSIHTTNCIFKLATERIEQRNDWVEYLIQLLEKRDYGDMNIELIIPNRSTIQRDSIPPTERPRNFIPGNKTLLRSTIEVSSDLKPSSLPNISIGINRKLSPRNDELNEPNEPNDTTNFLNLDENTPRSVDRTNEEHLQLKHRVTGLNFDDISYLHDTIDTNSKSHAKAETISSSLNNLNQLRDNFNILNAMVEDLSIKNESISNKVEDMMINSTFSMVEFMSLDVELLRKSSQEKDTKISKLEQIVIFQQEEINSLKEKYKFINEKLENLEDFIKNTRN